jgi:polysaccharide export outer membrane protein
MMVFAQQPLSAEETLNEQAQPLPLEQRTRVTYDAYILGPGDSIEIEVIDLPELSGIFTIGPDGTIYFPRLRALYAKGLTIEELRFFITEQLRNYVIEPELYVRPIRYRPIRVYVGGEVKRPGYYILSATMLNHLFTTVEQSNLSNSMTITNPKPGLNQIPITSNTETNRINTFVPVLPTVFDAIRTAQGITPYSDLSTVEVTRRQPLSSGGGRIRTKLNFLSLITEGDETQNIQLFDGDMVNVSKSPEVLRDQMLEAGQTNLTPQFLQVYVSGRVEQPGAVTLPQGSSLVQAIDLAGGTKVIRGKAEFIRFNREGEIDRRIFGFKSNAPAGDYRNPVLMDGDVIRLRENILTKSLAVIQEVTTPAVGVYSLFSLFNEF